jgi:hypothetical protein
MYQVSGEVNGFLVVRHLRRWYHADRQGAKESGAQRLAVADKGVYLLPQQALFLIGTFEVAGTFLQPVEKLEELCLRVLQVRLGLLEVGSGHSQIAIRVQHYPFISLP